MSVALVIFCLDEVERVLVSIRSMLGIVDEMVVIDSSPPIEHGRLLHRTKTSGVKIYHVVPIGFPEPLRPFGLSKVDSDYALILDADEEITDPLKDDLRDLNEFEAYVLPRLEAGLGSYTFVFCVHLQLDSANEASISRTSEEGLDAWVSLIVSCITPTSQTTSPTKAARSVISQSKMRNARSHANIFRKRLPSDLGIGACHWISRAGWVSVPTLPSPMK